MRQQRRRYVRRTPSIYGNLQRRERSWHFPSFGLLFRRSIPVLLVVGLAHVVFVGPLFKVRQVELRGVSLIEESELRQLVPTGGSLWTFPKEQVARAVSEYPTVEQVRILRGLPGSILIEVEERDATALWNTDGKTALLDSRGRVFLSYSEEASPTDDSALGQALMDLPRIHDVSGLPARPGEQVASALFLSFLNEVRTHMGQHLAQYPIDHFEVTATTYDVRMQTQTGLTVMLNSLGDAGVQVRNLARLARDGKLEEARNVDLRIDRWAYVR
jgi:hypothetical protein